MKYRPLPLYVHLTQILEDQGEDEMKVARGAAFLEIAQRPGFQLVTAILRDIEKVTLERLHEATDTELVHRLLGRLHCIKEIREALVRLLPEDQRPHVDWFDDQDEEFNLVEDTAAKKIG